MKQRLNLKRILLLLIFLFSLAYVFLQFCKYTGFLLPEYTSWDELKHDYYFSVNVTRYNSSALLFELDSPDYRGPLVIGNSFSNAHDYVHILPSMSGTKSINYSGETLRYVVNFPIYWGRTQPYAFFNLSQGISEALFLFFRPLANASYNITFSGDDLDIFDSVSGTYKNSSIILPLEDLMDSYFVFGNYSSCVKDYGNFDMRLIFQSAFEKNDSLCNDVFSLFDFYYSSFGRPGRARSNYTIAFSDARSFATSGSGFFSMWPDLRFVAHEMFHQWQSANYNCSDDLIYREGLTSFMEYYSQYETGLIKEPEFDEIYAQRLASISNSSALCSHYFDDNLTELRRESPNLYNELIYYRGSRVWYDIYKSGVNPSALFKKFLDDKDCSQISGLIHKYDQELFSSLCG